MWKTGHTLYQCTHCFKMLCTKCRKNKQDCQLPLPDAFVRPAARSAPAPSPQQALPFRSSSQASAPSAAPVAHRGAFPSDHIGPPPLLPPPQVLEDVRAAFDDQGSSPCVDNNVDADGEDDLFAGAPGAPAPTIVEAHKFECSNCGFCRCSPLSPNIKRNPYAIVCPQCDCFSTIKVSVARVPLDSLSDEPLLRQSARPPSSVHALLASATAPPLNAGRQQSSLDYWINTSDQHNGWVKRVCMDDARSMVKPRPPVTDNVSPVRRMPGGLPSFLCPPQKTDAFDCDHFGVLAQPDLNSDAQRILSALEDLPCMPNVATLTHCPRTLTRRFAQLVASSFLFQHLSIDCSERHVRLFSLLAYYMPLLLMHDSRIADSPDGPPEQADRPSARKLVADRIALAEAGDWCALISALQAALGAANDRLASSPKSDLPLMRKYEIACAKIMGKCYRAAASLLVDDASPPDSPETAAKCEALFVTHMPEHALDDYNTVATNIVENQTLTPPVVGEKTVRRRLQRLRAAAQPGSSRTRNSHLTCLSIVPLGVPALTLWCQDWASGRVPPAMADVWLKGHVKALGKPNGGVRPITLFEAPYKLATGCVLDLHQAQIAHALMPSQFGAMLSCGAELMTNIVRTLAASSGDPTSESALTFASTDIRNAFGQVPRSKVLSAVSKYCPGLIPILLCSWRSGSTPLSLPIGLGQWKTVEVVDGVFQGECLSSAVFCIVMRCVIDEFNRRAALLPQPLLGAKILAYVDDCVLVAPIVEFQQAWALWCCCLQDFGFEVVHAKCSCWLPGAVFTNPLLHCATCRIEAADWCPDGFECMSPAQSLNGLKILGSAACGNYCTVISLQECAFSCELFTAHLSPFAGDTLPDPALPHCDDSAFLTAPAEKRMASAVALCNAVLHMLNCSLPVQSSLPCWLLAVKVIAVKLDFDFRVSDPRAMAPLAESLSRNLRCVSSAVLGFASLPDIVFAQIALPGKLSGLNLRHPMDTLLAAPVASAAQIRAPAFAWLHCHCGMDAHTFCRSYPHHFATAALCCLADASVYLDHNTVVSVKPPDDPLTFLSAPSCSHTKVQGRICCALQKIRFLYLFKAAPDDRSRVRLLSCTGPGNGACFADLPTQDALTLIDADFRLAVYYRLGLPLFPTGARCKHHKKGDNASFCNTALCSDPDHPLMCKLGGSINRIHRAVAQLVALFCREVGLDTSIELVIPEFVRKARPPAHLSYHERIKFESAIMDVVATHPYLPTEFLVDATVRHPMSTRVPNACSEPGAAAAMGEADKHDRYPPSRGRQVTPCAIESWGRIGPEFHCFLQHLHTMGRRRDRAHGVPLGNYLQRWQIMLSATLNRAIARAIFDSLYAHSPQGDVLPPAARIDPDAAEALHSHFLQQGLFPNDAWTGAAPAAPLSTDMALPGLSALFHSVPPPRVSASSSSAPSRSRLRSHAPLSVHRPHVPLSPIPEREPDGVEDSEEESSP